MRVLAHFQLFERWSDYISRVWVEEGTIFRRNHPSLVNLFCWDKVVLIRALLECSVSKKTRGHARRIEEKLSRPKSPFLWLIRSPSVKKVRKNKKKWKKKDTLETYLIWQKPIYCDTPLSRLARRTFEYWLAPWLPWTAPKSPFSCSKTEPLRHFRCAQVDLGYCNTVW